MSQKKYTIPVVVLVVAALASLAGSAFAHHSFAGYEPQLQIKLTGPVSEFRWGNPHVYIEMDAPDKATGKSGCATQKLADHRPAAAKFSQYCSKWPLRWRVLRLSTA